MYLIPARVQLRLFRPLAKIALVMLVALLVSLLVDVAVNERALFEPPSEFVNPE